MVNLAVGPRTFRPSIFGKIATATYILTGVVTLYFNYLGQKTPIVGVFVYASLVITLMSAFHYLIKVVRIGQSQAPLTHHAAVFGRDLLPEVVERFRQPLFEADLRLPAEQRARARDVGLPDLRIVLGQRPVDELCSSIR